jgi:hypothetical protein
LKLVEKMGVAFAAYAEVLICEDCNNADTEAKRAVDAPTYFSFSPGQIKQFIRCQDHRPHSIDVEIARNKWCESKPSYELRMKIINAVARAAVTDAHWYEPYPLGTNPVPVFGNNRTGDQEIKQWVSQTTLFQRLGPQKKVSAPNLSRWRVQSQKLGNKPPPNFLAMLRSEEAFAKSWDTLSEDWHCPVCCRNKPCTVYVSEPGKVIFAPRPTKSRGDWNHAPYICNHCHSTLLSLKREIASRLGRELQSSYDFISPEELATIIVARPFSSHAILNENASNLILEILQRIDN